MNPARLGLSMFRRFFSYPPPVLSALLDMVYPRVCAGCGRAMGEDSGHICWDCVAGLDIIGPPYCRICGDPVAGLVEHEYVCSFCRKRKPHFQMARSAARYRGMLQEALHAFKYNMCMCLTWDFVRLLQVCAKTHYPDIVFDEVAFVPLHPKKERMRTYNQSKLLAAGLARRMGVPLSRNALRRVRHTESQTGLTASQRRRNVRGTFGTVDEQWVRGRTLLLVDDVMTTGATVNECARTLRESGAAGVYVLTVARG